MLKSDKKAIEYIKTNKIFPISKSFNIERWCVEGSSGIWTVLYRAQTKIYSCDCKNVRLTECAHIKAVKQYKEQNGVSNGKEI